MSIKVYSIPTNGDEPYLERLQTIKTPIPEPTYPKGLKPANQAKLDELKNAAASDHLVYDLPEGVQAGSREGIYKGRYQPDICLLPDTRTRWKDGEWEGWEKRAVIGMEGHHIFYVRGKREALGLNEHADKTVSGEMFLLRVSDTEDQDGRHFYVDVNQDPEHLDDLEDLLSLSSYLEYYGTQDTETDILARILREEGSMPTRQYIQAVTGVRFEMSSTCPTCYGPTGEASWRV